MTEVDRRSWKELCSAAMETKNDDEFLKLVRELNAILEREEQMRSDSSRTPRGGNAREEIPCL